MSARNKEGYPSAPCPFCGSKKVGLTTQDEQSGASSWRASCSCGVEGPKELTPDAAAKSWARRVPQENPT